MKRDTTIIEAGRRPEWTQGIVNPPVYRASTCIFERYQDLRDGVKDPDAGLFYGRRGTPTHWALREAITELEGGAGTWLYPSGMAAVAGAILACVRTGDHILVTDSVYEPTRFLCQGMLRDFGIETTFYDPEIGAGIEALFQENTRLVITESPGSLTLEVQDLPAISKVAHAHDALVLLDNTWATPLHMRAFDLGVDISVHAATKYIVGHSDVMLGTATANARAWPKLKHGATQMGHTASPDDVWLALRGLRTLPVRLKQHEASALKIAQWLQEREDVDQVLHPALPTAPGHDLFKRDFSGACGLFSFTLNRGSYDTIDAFVDDMRLFKIGFSWGGFESLILPTDPARVRSATKWQAPGPLLRLHVGLEDPDDLIDDLAKAFDRYNRLLNA
ncbi:cystathionine beta-lyase [Iodidimonas gelatinilytica]|uniref:Cystathionine beta-lyase n=1 Tax=Iodidimonas gelatinilytica TaxID=1236966 RepID=A0A5A7MWF1_9PROT|nr:cystathionine beta-lyase [Iodidimonas gelatinilytica]GER00383.1 cystathionine beta-lyase [Iodidimonas gelatinilytica]